MAILRGPRWPVKRGYFCSQGAQRGDLCWTLATEACMDHSKHEWVKQLSSTKMKQFTVARLVYSPASTHNHRVVTGWLSEWRDCCWMGDYWRESKGTPGNTVTRCACWCFSVRSQGQGMQPDRKETRVGDRAEVSVNQDVSVTADVSEKRLQLSLVV